MDDVAAFVLAGGRSSRMGRDKAFLEIDGRTLLERTLEILRWLTDDVRIVGPKGKFSPYGTVVEDRYRDRGPLGGIQAALAGTERELNLIVSVDTPFIDPEFLRFLVDKSREAQTLVSLPRVGERLQTLCAVYRRGFAPYAEQALERGENKIESAIGSLTIALIGEDDLRKFAFDPRMFENLNTPEDLERARQRWVRRVN
jgi:molybdenum cofactor guanylyltransferase